MSRDLANPRNPPTLVGPLGLAAWAGRDGEPSVRLLGLSTGDESAAEEGKMSDVETVGAGSTVTSSAASTTTAVPATPTASHGIPRVPAIDCHMATSAHTPNTSQATT